MQVRPNHFTQNPVKLIKRENVEGTMRRLRASLSRYFFPDEWIAFYSLLKTYPQKVTFNFLINTGARINEIQKLKVSDIDFIRQSIFFRKIYRRKIKTSSGKTTSRAISISTEFTKFISKVVKDYKLGSDDLFPILGTWPANKVMKGYVRKAGIVDWWAFSVHNVRKTHETWLMALDYDSLKVVKRVGHDIKTAFKYYVSSDTFDQTDKQRIRQIIGDLT